MCNPVYALVPVPVSEGRGTAIIKRMPNGPAAIMQLPPAGVPGACERVQVPLCGAHIARHALTPGKWMLQPGKNGTSAEFPVGIIAVLTTLC